MMLPRNFTNRQPLGLTPLPYRSVKLAATPERIPKMASRNATAALLREGLVADFQAFEKCLLKARRQNAEQARAADPHKIYQDVSRTQALPVHTSVSQNISQPTIEGMVFLFTWDPGFLTDPESLEPGDPIYQDVFVGSRREMLQQFQDLWMSKWNKHRHTTPERWQVFCRYQPMKCRFSESLLRNGSRQFPAKRSAQQQDQMGLANQLFLRPCRRSCWNAA